MVFAPALPGLGAPHWRPEARELFCGIDRSTTAGYLARAVLEDVALQIGDLACARGRRAPRDEHGLLLDLERLPRRVRARKGLSPP